MASCKNHCDTKFVQLHQLRFSLLHILLSLEMETISTGLFLLNFETAKCKNHFDMNLDKIHSVVIEILPISCFVQLLATEMAATSLESQIAKKSKWFHAKIIMNKS